MANTIDVRKTEDEVIVITISSDVTALLSGMRLSVNEATLLRNKLDMLLKEVERAQG
jgi:hypothetical protein